MFAQLDCHTTVRHALNDLLGSEHVDFTAPLTEQAAMGVERLTLGTVRPGTVEEVQGLVAIAREHGVVLYPFSKGRNLGYGSKAPAKDNQLLVDLGRLNRIREFDQIAGRVVVEPGVTQKQLYTFLKEQNAKFWMDATGAPLDSSPLGNSLEGGFGHTEKGNRRKCTSRVEVVLSDGTLLECGSFPNVGPDINGLFTQSNFGIITAIELELMPIPERMESFIISVDSHEGLAELVDNLRILKQQGTLTSLVHIANAMRTLMTFQDCPEQFAQRLISPEEAQKAVSSRLVKVGFWTASGALYGTAEEVAAKKKVLQRTFRKSARLRFFNDKKISRLKKLVSFPLWRNTEAMVHVRSKLDSLEHLHSLLQGVPTDTPERNISWRQEAVSEMGLRWVSPVMKAEGRSVVQTVDACRAVFNDGGFEMPVTLTFVEPNTLIGILNISFNRHDPDQVEKAKQAQYASYARLASLGIQPYRLDIESMAQWSYKDRGKSVVLERLKTALDPARVIALGRYGIT